MQVLLDGCKRETLLVGEGDFSFSLSFARQIYQKCVKSPESCMSHIVSSSIASNTSVRRHVKAVENMKLLKQIGVQVLLNIDACQLESHIGFRRQQFDVIIFNFPHVGGKSNIKKNRLLVQNFLMSARPILKATGCVYLTLCKGQGGTPCDSLKRKWNDSWQAVAMAANAGFILNRLVPFQACLFDEYSCTGFRSQDKGFHLDGAMTHVFVPADVVTAPPPMADITDYILDTVHRDYLSREHGPMALLVAEIDRKLEKLTSERVVKVHLDGHHKWLKQESRASSDRVYVFDNHVLRDTILCNLPDLLSMRNRDCDNFMYTYGDVYKPCLIDAKTLPQSHEMMIIAFVDVQPIVTRLLEDIIKDHNIRFVRTPNDAISRRGADFSVHKHGLLCCDKNADVVNLAEILSLQNQDASIAVIFLDALLTTTISLPSCRMIFSENLYFSSQFSFTDDEEPKDLYTIPFKPFSLHPVTYSHDMSFWSHESFDEHRFCDIIRNVAGDAVMEVKLIDNYTEDNRNAVFVISGRVRGYYPVGHPISVKLLNEDKGALTNIGACVTGAWPCGY